MISGWTAEIVARVAKKYRLENPIPEDILRRDLNDFEYADWFLRQKFEGGHLKPSFAMNDFVLFRFGNSWPKGLHHWIPTEDDLLMADYSLTAEQLSDIVDFAAEGLTDGYTSADWYLRLSILWHVDQKRPMPEGMAYALQHYLFAPERAANGVKVRRQGRRRSDNLDRDLIIRNAVEGLLARGCKLTGGDSSATVIVSNALGRLGVNIDPDGVRKVCARTPRTEREKRLWQAILVNLG